MKRVASGGREPLLGPREVSDDFNIPIATLARWRYQGTGPSFIKLGRHVRYRRSDLDDFLDSRATHTV